MWTQADHQKRRDLERLDTWRSAASRDQVSECYCGLRSACPLWRRYSPAQRTACSLDKRATAQALWMNGM